MSGPSDRDLAGYVARVTAYKDEPGGLDRLRTHGGDGSVGRMSAEAEPPEPPRVTAREMPDMAEVRARYRLAAMQGEHAEAMGGPNAHTGAAIVRSWQDVSVLHDSLRVLAVDLLAFAEVAGMPSTYWHSDERVRRALAVLDVTPEDAQRIDWADVL